MKTKYLAIAALSALSLVGCSDAPENDLGSTSEALFANDKHSFDFFVGKGLTPFQAAGIVGNLDQESGDSPTAVQSGGPGRGLAQWSVGGRWDHDSGDNLAWYASTHGGVSVWNLDIQLEFIWFELTNFSGYGLAALKATTNVTDATVVFQNKFEGCGTCVETQRVSYAKAVLAAYGATPSYAAQFVSQSFPLASTTMNMTEGDTVPSYIELKNTGSKAWDSKTFLATTQPRDRKSAFADSSWTSPSRLAGVVGTVPPGGTYKFKFNLHAPKAGNYDEFFGMVEDGVAWFSDSGEGGPADNVMEVKVHVAAKPPAPDAGTGSDTGTVESDSGTVVGDGGTVESDAGPVDDAGGTPTDDGGFGPASAQADVNGSASCSTSSPAGGGSERGWLLVVGAALMVIRKRK